MLHNFMVQDALSEALQYLKAPNVIHELMFEANLHVFLRQSYD